LIGIVGSERSISNLVLEEKEGTDCLDRGIKSGLDSFGFVERKKWVKKDSTGGGTKGGGGKKRGVIEGITELDARWGNIRGKRETSNSCMPWTKIRKGGERKRGEGQLKGGSRLDMLHKWVPGRKREIKELSEEMINAS